MIRLEPEVQVLAEQLRDEREQRYVLAELVYTTRRLSRWGWRAFGIVMTGLLLNGLASSGVDITSALP